MYFIAVFLLLLASLLYILPVTLEIKQWLERVVKVKTDFTSRDEMLETCCDLKDYAIVSFSTGTLQIVGGIMLSSKLLVIISLLSFAIAAHTSYKSHILVLKFDNDKRWNLL